MTKKDDDRKESTDRRKRNGKENPMGKYHGPKRKGRLLYEPYKRSRRVDEEMEIKERIGLYIEGQLRDHENEVFTLGYKGSVPLSNLFSVTSDPDLDFEESKDFFREIYPEAFRILRVGKDQNEAEIARDRIMFGISLNNLVKKSRGEDWEGIQMFCESLGINYQYAQGLMAIANYDDAMDFADLGIEKLYILVSHLKVSGFPGGIREFTEKNDFVFDDPRKVSLENFEIQISRVTMNYLNNRGKWNVPDELLNRYADMKTGRFSYNRLLRDLHFIKLYGGKCSRYFEVQIQNMKYKLKIKDVLKKIIQNTWMYKENNEKQRDPDIADIISVSNLDATIRELDELKQQIEENHRKLYGNGPYDENPED